MKILKIKAWNYKNCSDGYTIDFVAKTKKTAEDKEYELQEIAPELFLFNTMAFVGKNASGKTTALEIIAICDSIIAEFRTGNTFGCKYKNTKFEIYFYHDLFIYKYITELNTVQRNEYSNVEFSNEEIYRKKYVKSNLKDIFSFSSENKIEVSGTLPQDVSKIFFALGSIQPQCVFYDWRDENVNSLMQLLEYSSMSDNVETFKTVLKIFDENINDLVVRKDNLYELTYMGELIQVSINQLFNRLSIGTIKGIALYYWAALCLQEGHTLIVDEIENHFHKTLVENLISLFKDKKVNKNNATLIFATHYNELLDLFNRKDNINICRSEGMLSNYNMADNYKEVRYETLKSKAFYNNVFDTAVNYEYLMDLKRELMK